MIILIADHMLNILSLSGAQSSVDKAFDRNSEYHLVRIPVRIPEFLSLTRKDFIK
jgi:hypothetical protein